MNLFKLLDVSSPKIIRDTLNRTITAFNILEEYVTETANNALSTSEGARVVAAQSLEYANEALANSTQAVNTANIAHQKSEEAITTADEAKTESASAKSVADTAEANSISAINTATTAANTSATAEQNALAALETAQEALNHVVSSVGTQVFVNGEFAANFNADAKADVTYVDQKVADLIGSAPDTLDTLAELSGALRDNKDIIKVLEDAISTKANASDIMTILATKANTSDVTDMLATKANTSDVTDMLTTKANTSDLSSVTDAALSSDGKTLTITKRNGTSFAFQGSTDVDLSGYVQYADINDNLTSTATNKALSAYQGKVLNDSITTLRADLTTAQGNITSLSNNKANASDLNNYLPLTAGDGKKITGDLYVEKTTASVFLNRHRISCTDNAITIGIRNTSYGDIYLRPNNESDNWAARFGRGVFRPMIHNGVGLGTASISWGDIYGKDIYQNGQKIPTFALDGTTLTITI